MRRSPALIFLLALGACDKVPTTRSVTIMEATQIAERAEASFTKGDVKAIMAQYANNAVMIDGASRDPSTDRKVQLGWAQSFVSMQPSDFKVVNRQVQLLGGDAFISSGIETFTVAAGAGRPTVSARFTDVFQRQKDGSWKIVNEHVSMPPEGASAAAQ